MSNVFNTFSFNKWADQKQEEEIDKQNRTRTHEQIKRLKEKLRRERELREAALGNGGDVDLEALIAALQSGEAINSDSNPFANWHNGQYQNGTASGAGKPGMAGANGNGYGRVENDRPIELPDDYILSEIRRYTNSHGGSMEGFAEKRERAASAKGSTASAVDRFNWQYNRMYPELKLFSHSEPSSRSSSSARPRPRGRSATRSSSASRR